MGKNQTIKIIGRLIGGMLAHKILSKYTNRPESMHHLNSEVDNYSGAIFDHLLEYNWSSYDKEMIKKESEKSLKLSLKESHFSDVKFPESEISKLLNETIKEYLE